MQCGAASGILVGHIESILSLGAVPHCCLNMKIPLWSVDYKNQCDQHALITNHSDHQHHTKLITTQSSLPQAIQSRICFFNQAEHFPRQFRHSQHLPPFTMWWGCVSLSLQNLDYLRHEMAIMDPCPINPTGLQQPRVLYGTMSSPGPMPSKGERNSQIKALCHKMCTWSRGYGWHDAQTYSYIYQMENRECRF